MADTTQNQLVATIAYDLVAQTAPQELELFSITSEAYFKKPDQVRKNAAGKDEALGFGAGTIAALSPIIITVVDEVLKYILGELIPQGIKESGVLNKLFKKNRARRDRSVTIPPLTAEQMHQVYNQALKSALQFNLPRAQADQLATSLVGRLALVKQ